ncbi:MAG: EAL domain-containing protein [Epsilonproteobacteria bacterium]|nr:EAL domain-containing protein [Campylobacterota bacterium]
MKLNYRIAILSFIFIGLYLYASYTYIQEIYNEQLHERYTKTSNIIRGKLQTLINEKKEAILLLSIALSESDTIKHLLVTKQYQKLNLDSFSDKLKHHSSLHNVWFQIINPNGQSVYRSWSSKDGDNILSIRNEIKKIINKPRIISLISVGRYDITFKAIVPIYHQKKFLGLIETIAKFNSIGRKLQTENIDNLLIVDKRYKNQLKFANKEHFFNGYYISNKNPNKIFLHQVVKELPLFIHIRNFIIKEEKLFTTYTLFDIDQQPMAYFVLAKPLSQIDISDIKNQKITLISIAIIIFIGIALFIYYIYFINYKKFVKKQTLILQKNVAHKTKELQKQSEILKYQAEHDPLTNLPNRLLFLDRLKQALKYAKRKNGKVSVLFFDLDRFKEINDTYGHEVGDKLLQEVTKRLTENRRSEDTVARLGGDEFTLLLLNQDQDGIIHVVTSIMKKMEKPFYINNLELYTTFSIGISSYPEDGTTHDELLRNADTAMYEAKMNGKNNYHFYNSKMTEIAIARTKLEKELRKALENKEFIPYFQPKIDAKHNKIVGLEALVRWQHPTKGIVFPDKFIPFAEEIGLITAIDNYMMKASMKQVLLWQQEGIECGKLSINLSAKQLNSKSYLNELKTALNETKFDPKYLEIEITETHIMRDPSRALTILEKIKSLGISIAIDDFGTGYSSLSYLKKLPITKLKIDRSFVIDIPEEDDDVAIVRTIISLAKNLRLDIIAEGVEKKEQVEFLVQEGCNDIQGYYFSKPLDTQNCKEFLKNYQ